MQIRTGIDYMTRKGQKVRVQTFSNHFASVGPIDGGHRVFQHDGTHGNRCVRNIPEYDLISEWTEEPTGTLQWLTDNHGLKAGDTVVCVDNHDPSLIGDVCVINSLGNAVSKDWGQFIPSCDAQFGRKYCIVFRADVKPKIWDDMSREEQFDLWLHYREGGDLQVYSGGNWFDGNNWTFVGNCAYRVKPELVGETVTLYGNARGYFATFKADSDTHKMTYTTTNDVIDCDSVKMEEL